MNATLTFGSWKKALQHGFAFAVLFGCAYLFWPLTFIIAITLPLMLCPAFVRGRTVYALLMPLAPVAAYLLTGGDVVFAVIALIYPYLCLGIVSLKNRNRLSINAEAIMIGVAFLVCALTLLVRLGELLGGSLFVTLPEYAITQLRGSIYSGNILSQLVSMGVLYVPAGYQNGFFSVFGRFVVLNPQLQNELINMLRPRLAEFVNAMIPAVLMQGTILLGFFTAWRAERAYPMHTLAGMRRPSFTALRLSKQARGYMLVLCIGILLTRFSANPIASQMNAMMYASFSCVFQVLGAAVMVSMLAQRHPERTNWYGILAALVYLIAPLVLLLIGVADQFVHFRTVNLQSTDQKEE